MTPSPRGLILGPHDFSPLDSEGDADLDILAIRTVPLSFHLRGWGTHGLQPGKYARLNILSMHMPAGEPPSVSSAIVLPSCAIAFGPDCSVTI